MRLADQRQSAGFAHDHVSPIAKVRATASPQLLALVPIERGNGVPLHQQVYDGLRRAIVERLLRPRERLPATRVLAQELGMSRLPVLTAYERLLHDGYLEGRVGSGTFVATTLPDDSLIADTASDQRRAGGPVTRPRSSSGPSIVRERLQPFRVSVPALDRFPHHQWAKLVVRHARALSPANMAYGDPAGVEALREAIAQHLRSSRAVRCEADQVLIVSGSQAALRLCASVLLAPGNCVAVEDPGYPGAHAALRASNAVLVPIPVDSSGIDVRALDAATEAHDPLCAVYVTPSHQYPIGVSMSASRRIALLDWAHRRSTWVIEDDYDSEYRYVSRPLGALQGMDDQGRVIYEGTFSKVLFPALRVGYVIVPPTLWQRFLAAREALDLFPPTLYQLVLAEFLAEGHFVRHLRRMRGIYLQRRDALLHGLNRHCADVLTVQNADAGLHVATTLRLATDDIAVVRCLASRGLSPTALSSCYVGAEAQRGLLLGFGGSTEAQLVRATRVLGEVLHSRC